MHRITRRSCVSVTLDPALNNNLKFEIGKNMIAVRDQNGNLLASSTSVDLGQPHKNPSFVINEAGKFGKANFTHLSAWWSAVRP